MLRKAFYTVICTYEVMLVSQRQNIFIEHLLACEVCIQGCINMQAGTLSTVASPDVTGCRRNFTGCHRVRRAVCQKGRGLWHNTPLGGICGKTANPGRQNYCPEEDVVQR